MANLSEQALYELSIYQIETTDPVVGGPDGVSNTQAKQLANRTAYLKQQVELRAPVADPTFTGTPQAPTPAPGTNTNQIATTAFVIAVRDALINGAPGLLDALNELADAIGNDPNFAATMATQLGLKAPLESPNLTGTPTAPTAAPGTKTTQLATTEFASSAGVPIGTPLFCMTASPPPGFIKRNGALISRATFSNLWDYAFDNSLVVSEAAWAAGEQGLFAEGDGSTSFRVPEGRAHVLRGWDDGFGVDTGRGLGTTQLDALQGFQVRSENFLHYGGRGPANVLAALNAGNQRHGPEYSQPVADEFGNGPPRLAAETRMRNIAYTPIIKF